MRIVYTNQCKKDFKRMLKRGHSADDFEQIARKLAAGQKLPPKNKDHWLTGQWNKSRECHIAPDWLLIYTKKVEKHEDVLIFERTGTHSDLFR